MLVGCGPLSAAAYNRLVSAVLVLAAYRFVEIDDCQALRQRLDDTAAKVALKGTVLLAREGINVALAGAPAAVRGWLAALTTDARFTTMEFKLQTTDTVPFRHLRVKVKPEIIRMNQPTVRPQAGRAAAVDAATLARWLDAGHCDEGRPVVMLDTRNAFEVDAGRFEGAIDWRLGRFSDFPAALQSHAEALQGKTVVSYCTGGIRCEKAALWAARCGVPHMRQLDGGILRYFEAAPGAPHWLGRCVVFDEREALAPTAVAA